MPQPKPPLSDQECLDKALECRELAKSVHNPAYRTMLEHMAETWERICEDIRKASRRRHALLMLLA